MSSEVLRATSHYKECELPIEYRDAFGMAPEMFYEVFRKETADPEQRSPVTQYTMYNLGSRATREVIVLSGIDHCFDPQDELFAQTAASAEYTLSVMDAQRRRAYIEGTVGVFGRDKSDEFVFSKRGELGLFEAKLLDGGTSKESIQPLEPLPGEVGAFAEIHGGRETLKYFVLREFPQWAEGDAHVLPFSMLYFLYAKHSSAFGLDEDRRVYSLYDAWNERQPPDLQFIRRRPTKDLLAAIRQETTFVPILATPPEKRSDMQHVALCFNLLRQMNFRKLILGSLEESDDDVVFAAGLMHRVAIDKWLERYLQFSDVEYERKDWKPVA
jgi:hypothetical protein